MSAPIPARPDERGVSGDVVAAAFRPPTRPNGGTVYFVSMGRIAPPVLPNGGGTLNVRPEMSDD